MATSERRDSSGPDNTPAAENGTVAVEAELPDGVTGVLSLPGRADEEIGAGTHRAEYR